MKLYSPDKSLLIDVRSLSVHPEGLQIEGQIMGAMPMKAILRPDELHLGRALLSWAVVRQGLRMFFRPSSFKTRLDTARK